MLVFDIETKANPEALIYLEQPSAPGNYKDPQKIADYIKNETEKQISRATLDPDYGMVAAIGIHTEDGITEFHVVNEEMSETDVIKWFWLQVVKYGPELCGYNIIGFDLPFLLRRSFYLDIVVPTGITLRKYQTSPMIDLMGILYNWSPDCKGLKQVCKLAGIENNFPEWDGSLVAEMTEEELGMYLLNDIRMTYRLYLKMKGIYL